MEEVWSIVHDTACKLGQWTEGERHVVCCTAEYDDDCFSRLLYHNPYTQHL